MKPFARWPILGIVHHWFAAADNAMEGILHAAKTQRHLQFHLAAAFSVLLGCFVIGLDKNEFAAIALAIIVVIVAEMFNSALEAAVDLVTREHEPLARIAKDMAAGAVLVSAVGALVIGVMILGPHLVRIGRGFYRVPSHSPGNIAVLSLIMIMLIVILIKAYGGHGHPLRGGFPSGQAASAFSLWISLIHVAPGPWFVWPGLLAAAAMAASRLRSRMHKWRDIVFGSLLGTAVTLVLFRIFYR
jgi:diacylglycerol kinase (ATP)